MQVASGLAESLFEWRNLETQSPSETIKKRIITELAVIPCLAVALVETAVRAFFAGLSYLGLDLCGSCGSMELFKESLHLVPIFILSLIDNLYAKNVDKDNQCLVGAYAKFAFRED